MINSFEILNRVFELCVANPELCKLLNINTELTGEELLEEQNRKIRREYQTADVIEPEDAPFISVYFMHAEKSKNNWLVNIGVLYVDIYTHSMYEAQEISLLFRMILADDFQPLLNYEGQHYSGVTGVYKYRLIYNPLMNGQ